MIYDCHLHTEFSGDSDTPVRRQIERAIRLGMMEMCITDHHDYDTSFCDTNLTWIYRPISLSFKALGMNIRKGYVSI